MTRKNDPSPDECAHEHGPTIDEFMEVVREAMIYLLTLYIIIGGI